MRLVFLRCFRVLLKSIRGRDGIGSEIYIFVLLLFSILLSLLLWFHIGFQEFDILNFQYVHIIYLCFNFQFIFEKINNLLTRLFI